MDICDDFLTSLPIESSMLSNRMDFSMDDIASSSCDELLHHNDYMTDLSENAAPVKRLKTESNYTCSSSNESIDYIDFGPDYYQTVNPDDFLNDLFKSEIKSEVGSSPNRDTPSPTISSSSSDFNEFRIDMPPSNGSETCASPPSQFIFETPPISPPSPGASSSSSSTSSMLQNIIPMQGQQHSAVPLNFTRTGPKLNILQGTLIPIATMPLSAGSFSNLQNLKKIKIQPKPATPSNIVAGITKKPAPPAKRIVLSAQDYKALVQKCKTQPAITSLKPIILKAAAPNTNTNNLIPGRIVQPSSENGSSTSLRPVLSATAVRTPITSGLPRLSNPTAVPSMCTTTTITPAIKAQVKTTMKQELEEKIMKKHQRMIKNRESACLSRKKKKDYMTSLETQITNLWEENEKLRTENGFLRDRLTQLESVVCKCGKTVGRQLSNVLNASSKKNAMFLLAVVFMVSLNFGPIGNLFSTQMSARDLEDTSVQVHHSRGLLWADEDTNNLTSSIHLTNLYNDSSTSPSTKSDAASPYPTCPLLQVNQTESVRLASELRRWIGDLPEHYNFSSSQEQQHNFNLNTISEFLFPDDTIKSLFHKIKNVKNYIKKKSKRRAAAAAIQQERRNNDIVATPSHANKIQVYNPNSRQDMKYAELFEELRRQDDTFYVVSFSGDHLLLPALAHNKTFRPKMSLMLPSVGPNGTYSSEFITLMQIDCEVVNTSLIHIKEKLIPKHLRSKAATTGPANTENVRTAQRTKVDRTFDRMSQPNYTISENVSDEATVEAKDFNKLYKPYFVGKTFLDRKLAIP